MAKALEASAVIASQAIDRAYLEETRFVLYDTGYRGVGKACRGIEGFKLQVSQIKRILSGKFD